MRKFTLSMLVLFVSVFFVSHIVLGQATKTAEIQNYIPAVATDGVMTDTYSCDFEDLDDWAMEFTPWTVVDLDGLPTYGMTGVTWPGSGDPQSFIVFNPATTDPPTLDDPELQPYEGDKFGACLASVPDGGNGNDDWFISDMVSVGDGAYFNFWAKSYTDQYGLERMNVAVSTTTPDPSEFTVISGDDYIEVPMAWTEYTFDLSMYSGMDIYVAIQCVTYDAFIFMIDNLMIDPGAPPTACENFDALTPGDYVAVELGEWTTWSNNPGSAEDALITDAQANSVPNSFIVEGSSDLVHAFTDANLESGKYYYSNMMYVPDGFCGYWNLQKDVSPGVEWGFQVMFDADGMASADAGAEAAAVFPFTFDEWHMNELIVDLDNDWAEYWFDGVLMVEWQWTLGTFGDPGMLALGGANYYAWSGQGDPMCYFDDVCFEEVVESDCENFDALTAGGYVAEQLGGYWTTWGGTPGGADDAMVTDEMANSAPNSFVVDAGAVDLIYQFGDMALNTGEYLYSHYMYVPTGFSGYFNVQADPTPGVDWNIELYFDDGGTGSFAGQSTETFTYTQDTWFMVEVYYDLDAGIGRVYFDGAMIIEFVNEMTIGGIDYYGSDNGGPPGAYYDDVCFVAMSPQPDCENFDGLTVGGLVADQLGDPWTTWSGTPGSSEDAPVSDMYANSMPNSFTINSGSIDLIYQLGDEAITEGQWLYSHWMYVPSGFTGYFNVQTDPVPGTDWNLDLYFMDGGMGEFGTQSTETFEYPMDTWFKIEINYDLDHGYAQVLFDGTLIVEFMNTLTIGGIDYWGWEDEGPAGAYYDDVCFGPGWVITSIEEPAAANINAVLYPNPARDQITIESENIIEEVLIYNNMGQLVYSGEFNNDQIMVNTSTFITGMYIVQVRSGEAVEVRKLIIE